MTNTQKPRHLSLVPAAPRKTHKVSGDQFRTPEAQAMFRERWNVAQARLAR
jgi:hypothetical protein